jgi:hypothetical protein
MAHATTPDLLVMHTIRLKGFAEPPAIVEATGVAEPDTIAIVEDLGAGGMATRREGRVTGWVLTPDGKVEHRRRLAEDRQAAKADAELEVAYSGFLEANGALKGLCTDWQLRVVDGEQVINDHSDSGYDAAITERLDLLHRDVVPVLDDLAGAVARFGRYPARLSSALDRFQAGDPGALARPLSGSYHDVWMELHEDLLLSLGRERSDADGH